MITDELLNILVCPKCRGKLILSANKKTIDCESCLLAYDILEDTPVLLIDKAKKIER